MLFSTDNDCCSSKFMRYFRSKLYDQIPAFSVIVITCGGNICRSPRNISISVWISTRDLSRRSIGMWELSWNEATACTKRRFQDLTRTRTRRVSYVYCRGHAGFEDLRRIAQEREPYRRIVNACGGVPLDNFVQETFADDRRHRDFHVVQRGNVRQQFPDRVLEFVGAVKLENTNLSVRGATFTCAVYVRISGSESGCRTLR